MSIVSSCAGLLVATAAAPAVAPAPLPLSEPWSLLVPVGVVDCGVTLATMLAETGGCELVAMLLSGVWNMHNQPSADVALHTMMFNGKTLMTLSGDITHLCLHRSRD